jgi:hypothetical protein
MITVKKDRHREGYSKEYYQNHKDYFKSYNHARNFKGLPKGCPPNPDREQVKRNIAESKNLWGRKNQLYSEYRGMLICPKCGEKGCSIYKYYKTEKFGYRLSKLVCHRKEITGSSGHRRFKNKVCSIVTVTVDSVPCRFNSPVKRKKTKK